MMIALRSRGPAPLPGPDFADAEYDRRRQTVLAGMAQGDSTR